MERQKNTDLEIDLPYFILRLKILEYCNFIDHLFILDIKKESILLN